MLSRNDGFVLTSRRLTLNSPQLLAEESWLRHPSRRAFVLLRDSEGKYETIAQPNCSIAFSHTLCGVLQCGGGRIRGGGRVAYGPNVPHRYLASERKNTRRGWPQRRHSAKQRRAIR